MVPISFTFDSRSKLESKVKENHEGPHRLKKYSVLGAMWELGPSHPFCASSVAWLLPCCRLRGVYEGHAG